MNAKVVEAAALHHFLCKLDGQDKIVLYHAMANRKELGLSSTKDLGKQVVITIWNKLSSSSEWQEWITKMIYLIYMKFLHVKLTTLGHASCYSYRWSRTGQCKKSKEAVFKGKRGNCHVSLPKELVAEVSHATIAGYDAPSNQPIASSHRILPTKWRNHDGQYVVFEMQL